MAISDRIAVFNVGRLEQVGTPKEIYNSPKNGAVARFVGDINRFGGRAAERLRGQLSADPDATFYIRPHKLGIVPRGGSCTGDVRFDGVIESFEYLGAYTKIAVRVFEDQLLHALMFGADTEFAVGEPVCVQLASKDVLALKEE